MEVKANDYILFKMDDALFDRATDFTIYFYELACITNSTFLFTKFNSYKNCSLNYNHGTSRLYLRDSNGVIIWEGRSYSILFYRKGWFQGKVKSLSPSSTLSIDQATPAHYTNRFIDMGWDGVVHGTAIYKNQEQIFTIEVSQTDQTDVEITIKPNQGYMNRRAIMSLQLDLSVIGYSSVSGYALTMPYTYKQGKITIPACCIFENVNDEIPNLMSVELIKGEDTRYYCFIDNKQVMISDGFTIKDELNETLDSGTLEFVSIGGEFPLDPFDSVYIESELVPNFESKKQLIDVYQGSVSYFANSLETSDYHYQVNLFSETKQLERITLPNLAITKRANGTQQTVWEKVKEYCRFYLPYVRIYDTINEEIKLVPCLKYDPELPIKLNMECPEFVWNTPTLREVLTDLFSVADLLPIVKNNVLTFFDLRHKGNPIDTTKITNKEISGTSADYCDSMTLPMKNIISKSTVVRNELVMPKTDGAEMTTENAVWKTQKPIYKIVKATLWIKRKKGAWDEDVDSDYVMDGAQIQRFILEKKEYDLMQSGNYNSVNINTNMENYNLPYMYYERGSNEIKLVSSSVQFRTGISAKTFNKMDLVLYLGNLPNSTWSEVLSGEPVSRKPSLEEYGTVADGREAFIQLEYETIEETTINYSRQKPIKHMQNSLFDSQSANSVDLEHQSIFEYAKINRLANKIETIYGEYFDEADIPQLGDYIGEKILFSREISYYDDQIYFKGMIVDNYVLRDYFTGVQSKRRSWNIADTNEAINRDDVHKIYFAFCDKIWYEKYVGKVDELPFEIQDDYQYPFELGDFINILQTGSKKYKNALITTDETPNYYALETLKLEIPNSLLFTFRTFDNFSVGNKVDKVESGANRWYRMTPLSFVDDNGELNTFEIYLVKEYDQGNNQGDFMQKLEHLYSEYTDEEYNWILGQISKAPSMDLMSSGNKVKIITHFEKDNREIIGSIVHFEYVSNSQNIIVGKNYAKCVAAGSHTIQSSDIGVRISTNHNYHVGDTMVAAGEDGNVNRISFSQSHIQYYDFQNNPNHSWCIYQISTGEILLAVNGVKDIYCNMLYVRDINVYNDQVHKEKIGVVGDNFDDLAEASKKTSKYITEFKVLNRTVNVNNLQDF